MVTLQKRGECLCAWGLARRPCSFGGLLYCGPARHDCRGVRDTDLRVKETWFGTSVLALCVWLGPCDLAFLCLTILSPKMNVPIILIANGVARSPHSSCGHS